MARKSFARGEDIVVVFGDTPLVRAETLRKLAGTVSWSSSAGVSATATELEFVSRIA